MNTTTADRTNRVDLSPQHLLELRRTQKHDRCVLCGHNNEKSLSFQCRVAGEQLVIGMFQSEPWMEGYDGQLHGGIIASLLDSAMVQCLFAHDHVAQTAKLEVRYTRPAPLGVCYRVEAHIAESRGTRHRMRAMVTRDNQVVADAKALFLDRK